MSNRLWWDKAAAESASNGSLWWPDPNTLTARLGNHAWLGLPTPVDSTLPWSAVG